jgi:uncharacterized protein (TIGR02453 family)
MAQITKKTFNFLELLVKNNNREWFQANRDMYEASHEEMVAFAAEINQLIAQHDHIVERSPKRSLFRIYRDVRFSKDKTPYKNNWGGGIKRDTPFLRGGYYYQVQPGNSFMAAGFWNPNSADIKLIRSQIAADPSEINRVTSEQRFIEVFGKIEGDKLKKAPQGYDVDHPAIDWLRHKQFVVRKPFTDKEVMKSDFVYTLNETFKEVRPFFDYMSEILTTDLNGEPLY